MRSTASVAGLLLAAACSPPGDRPMVDSPAASPASAPVERAAPSTWSGELGRFLALPADGESLAVVLLPDQESAMPPGEVRITLLNAAGDTATVVAELDTLQCVDAPLMRLGGTLAGWWVGLQNPSAHVIRMDSIEALSRADSSRITTALARLASGLSSNGNTAFTGLPFAVARARRFAHGNREIVVGHLVRRVPQEAAPVEEHTLIIAERPVRRGAPFELAFSQRSDGTEENAEHFEVLAALRTADALFIILARDRVLQSTYQVLRRAPTGEWTAAWTRQFRC